MLSLEIEAKEVRSGGSGCSPAATITNKLAPGTVTFPLGSRLSLLYGEVDIFFQHFEGFTNIVQRVVHMKGYS